MKIYFYNPKIDIIIVSLKLYLHKKLEMRNEDFFNTYKQPQYGNRREKYSSKSIMINLMVNKTSDGDATERGWKLIIAETDVLLHLWSMFWLLSWWDSLLNWQRRNKLLLLNPMLILSNYKRAIQHVNTMAEQ